MPFLHTISETLGLRTSQILPDCFEESSLQFINETINFYALHNFEVKLIDANLKFKLIKDLTCIAMNLIDLESNAHPAERSIHTVKERL